MGGSQSSSSSVSSAPQALEAPVAVNSASANADRNTDVGRDMNASKMRGECRQLAADSYKCLEKGDHEACRPFFDAYKECRKNEHAKVLAENGKKF